MAKAKTIKGIAEISPISDMRFLAAQMSRLTEAMDRETQSRAAYMEFLATRDERRRKELEDAKQPVETVVVKISPDNTKHDRLRGLVQAINAELGLDEYYAGINRGTLKQLSNYGLVARTVLEDIR